MQKLVDVKRVLMGVGGGTGSGKTTVTQKIVARLPAHSTAIIDLDSYYLDHSDIPLVERRAFNYDHPDAFDWPLVQRHVSALLSGNAIDKPLYSFAESVRVEACTRVEPHALVIIEGILALHDAWLRERMDLRVFVDNDADVRLARRLQRDVQERGRSVDHVLDQYFRSVRPMHLQFCWPSRRHADVVLPNEGVNDVAVELVAAGLRAALAY